MQAPPMAEPFAAAAIDDEVYVSLSNGGHVFMTPEAVLASLDKLKAAAEAALRARAEDPPLPIVTRT